MAYISLYRKWRPQVFEDVVEQEHVVRTLRNAVNTGRIAHAYLFCGTRGTGKTTMAQIFSRAINCLEPVGGDPCNKCSTCQGVLSGSILDVVEIDAASNNSVDNVREIRDEVVYAPSQARYKVYIIDEVHMLSSGAFNALLKTLEEPPSHVVFILATTEPHKLPATILSRCQRFDFRRISVESIVGRLEKIAESNGVTIHKEAARLIARMADGALRDAISILDQCISTGSSSISYDDVLSVVGIVHDTFISDVADAVGAENVNEIFRLVDRLVMDGKDIAKFSGDLVQYYRNLLVCKVADDPGSIVDASDELLERMKKQSGGYDRNELILIIKELSSLEAGLKWAVHPRVLLEAALVRICEGSFSAGRDDIMARLDAMERRLASGAFSVRAETAHAGAEAGKSEGLPAGAAEDHADVRDQAQAAENDEVRTARKKSKEDTPADGAAETGVTADSAKALENWDSILNELSTGGRMSLYTNLLNARAVQLNDRVIGMVFGKGCSFNKMFVAKSENLEVLEELLSERLGRAVRVKCLNEGDMIEEYSREGPEEKDELVEKAEDIARKLNVSLNIIDE